MPVDLTGFRKKIDRAGGLKTIIRPLLQDAGQYMEARLVDDILNGESGTDYPKTYPASVSLGATGFVGVVSGNLRRSITTVDKGDLILVISSPGAAPVAQYNVVIDEWARERYGKGYFEISIDLYGGFIEKQLTEVIRDFSRRVSQGSRYVYRNPFPA